MSATLTAERSHTRPGPVGERIVYRLSEPTTTEEVRDPFEYVVLSRGRLGDTVVFPSDATGGALDFVGFGFGMGVSRWLADDEADAFVAACIAQHLADGGTGITVAPTDWAVDS